MIQARQSVRAAEDAKCVLLIAPIFWPQHDPEAIVTAKLAHAFVNAGYQIQVVTQSDLSLPTGTDHDPLFDRLSRFVTGIAARAVPGAVHRTASRFFAAATVGQIVPGIVWARRVLSHLERARDQQWRMILSRALPAYAHLPATRLARRFGSPWIANWNDPYPPNNWPKPLGSGPRFPIRAADRHFLTSVASHATCNTFPCRRLLEYSCQYFPSGIERKSAVIPHIALEEFYDDSWSADGPFTLALTGLAGEQRRFESFAHALAIFRREYPAVALTVLHSGPEEDHVRPALASAGVLDVFEFLGRMSYRQCRESFRKAHVLVSIEAPLAEGIFLPSKVADFAQAGKPILAIAPTNGTLSDLLSEHGGGIAADVGDPAAIGRALSDLYSAFANGCLAERYGAYRLRPVFSPRSVLQAHEDIIAHTRLSQSHR